MNPITEFMLVQFALPVLAVAILTSLAAYCYIKYRQYAARETVIEPIVSSYRNAKAGDVLRAKL